MERCAYWMFKCRKVFVYLSWLVHIRGGFRGVSEVSRNHSGFSLNDGFSATTFLEAYTAGWIVVLTGLCFDSKLRKCSKDFFLVTTKENWRPSQKFVLQCHWKLCAKISSYVSATNRLLGNYSAKSLESPLVHIHYLYWIYVPNLISLKYRLLKYLWPDLWKQVYIAT